MMKNFKNEIEQKIMGEEILLPESLSAENIEKLINEKGGILEPKRVRQINTKTVVRWCSAAAAALIVLVGVVAVAGNQLGIKKKPVIEMNDEEQQQIIENHAAENSDYSEIHKSVLTYYKDIYNSKVYTQADTDANSGIFNGIFDGFVMKEEAAMDVMSGNSTSSNSSISSPSSAPSTDDSSESVHSTTNTQVQGVDEADIVKTDGEYIYFARTYNNEVVVTKCTDPAKLFISSRIKLAADDEQITPVEMFLYENNLIVIARKYNDYNISAVIKTLPAGDCCCYAVRSDTIVRMYDIADKENPKEIHSQTISGEYISSRITDGRLVLVTRFDIPYYSVSASDFDIACQAMREICIPEYSVNGSAMQRIPADRINMLGEAKPSSYVITAVTDLDGENIELKLNAFLGNASEIYCTKDELFVAESDYSYWTQNGDYVAKDSTGRAFDSVTKIMRMTITSDGTEYISSVTVGGRCINQFSMDEYGDYFRIATIGTDYNTNLRQSMVYVLDKDMQIIGFLDGIATGEDMKSARFLGNSLYLVTFLQTDPLFVIDLSDVKNPEVKGELKIPGFSTYLHPIGDGLVIGLGEGGSMTGTDGTAKISLFDVSDPCNPKELDNYTTADYACFAGGHKGFITVDENTYAAALLYGYSSGVVLVFDVENRSIVIRETYIGMSGATNYENVRGVVIGDILFVVNNAGITSYDMTEKYAFEKCRLSFF